MVATFKQASFSLIYYCSFLIASTFLIFSSSLFAESSNTLANVETQYKTIKVERHGPIIVGRFDNPPRYTMNRTVVAELSDFLYKIEEDEGVRILILTGASDKIFISHYDVSEIGSKSQQRSEKSASEGQRPLHGMHQVLLQIESLSKPVIAAINGRAHGGGYETALACDFRFLSSNGSVGLPEVGIGIIPGGGGTQRLPRLIGHSKAKQLIMLGKVVDANTALELGMVDFVTPPDKLMEEAMAFAQLLSQKSATALASVKQSFNQGLHLPLEEAMHVEQAAYYRATRSVSWDTPRSNPAKDK